MNAFRIALASLRPASNREEAVEAAEAAILDAGAAGAGLVAFPECFVPGYRFAAGDAPPPDAAFLESAWNRLGRASAAARLVSVVGTERQVGGELRISAAVLGADGAIAGFQDKVQLDPSEEAIYAPGAGRRLFQADPVTFGIAICHEGWRYPETVRWAARRGAKLVVHPHVSVPENGAVPAGYGEAGNTFHEKAVLCRAAENSCYFASVNVAIAGAPTTSAVAGPDGTLLAHQPRGKPGLLIADLDLDAATGMLAGRLKAPEYP